MNLAGRLPATLNIDLGGTWMQTGLGASGQITANVSLFASADHGFAIDDDSGEGVSGRAELRVVW